MFQNIADMGSEQESINNKTNDIKYRLKEIFKYQNVIIYILTLLFLRYKIK